MYFEGVGMIVVDRMKQNQPLDPNHNSLEGVDPDLVARTREAFELCNEEPEAETRSKWWPMEMES